MFRLFTSGHVIIQEVCALHTTPNLLLVYAREWSITAFIVWTGVLESGINICLATWTVFMTDWYIDAELEWLLYDMGYLSKCTSFETISSISYVQNAPLWFVGHTLYFTTIPLVLSTKTLKIDSWRNNFLWLRNRLWNKGLRWMRCVITSGLFSVSVSWVIHNKGYFDYRLELCCWVLLYCGDLYAATNSHLSNNLTVGTVQWRWWGEEA